MSSSVNFTLKEVLNYREKCLIHNKPFIPYSLCLKDYERKVVTNKFGLHLIAKNYSPYEEIDNNDSSLVMLQAQTNQNGVNFKYDGTYDCNNGKCPEWLISNPLIIHMMCYYCAAQPTLTPRSLGHTTINDVFIKEHYYSFILQASLADSFKATLFKERIQYTQDGKFYHMEGALTTGRAVCKMGSNTKTQSLDDLVKGMFMINIPNYDMKRIKTIDQMIDKIKLFNLLS